MFSSLAKLSFYSLAKLNMGFDFCLTLAKERCTGKNCSNTKYSKINYSSGSITVYIGPFQKKAVEDIGYLGGVGIENIREYPGGVSKYRQISRGKGSISKY